MAIPIRSTLWPVLIIALFMLTLLPGADVLVAKRYPPPRQWEPWGLLLHTALCVAIGGLAIRAPLGAWLSPPGRMLGKLRALPDGLLLATGAACFFLLAAYLSGALFAHLPHVADTHAQYVQSKMLAQGHLYLPSGPHARFFDTQWFINDGKFYAKYPPGHALLLAVGQLTGTPWIINPLLGACALIATHGLAREIGGRAAGRIAILLVLCSPFILFMSSEYMNHATALLMATLFAWFYIRACKYGRWQDALIAGMAMGYLLITRPQVAIAFGFPFALHTLSLLGRRLHWRMNAVLLAGAIPFVLFFLYYNWQTTGEPLLTGYEKYDGRMVVPGLAFTELARWAGWMDDLGRASSQALALHHQLFGWPISSLFLVFALFIARAQKPYCTLLAAGFFSVFFGLTLQRFKHIELFGPRYLYETSGVLIALSALGVRRLPAICRHYFSLRAGADPWRGLTALMLAGLVATGWAANTRFLYARYAHNYWEGNAGFYGKIVNSVRKPALVFMGNPTQFRYVSFTLPPDDGADIIFARDLNEKNTVLMDHYRNRTVYVVWDDAIQRIR